jgi:hypothetical protein
MAKLEEIQQAAPATMRVCHTLIGFNVIAGVFRRQVQVGDG